MSERTITETGVRVPSGAAAFVLYGNLHVGAIAACFVLGTYALLGLPVDVPLVVLAFSGTFLVYQLDRALKLSPEDRFNQPGRLAWLDAHPWYVRLSGAAALVVSIAMIPQLRMGTLGFGVVLGVLSVLYAAPAMPGGWRLKGLGTAKPVLIAVAWAVGGVLLPVVQAGSAVATGVVALLAYRALFVFPNAMLADWPDRAGDAEAGLETVATQLPIRHIRAIAGAALVLALTGGLVATAVGAAPALLGVDLLGPALMLVAVLWPLPRSRWFYGFLIDLIIAWPGVTALVAALHLL